MIVSTVRHLECLLIAFLIVLLHSFLCLASLLFRPSSNKDLSLSLSVSLSISVTFHIINYVMWLQWNLC